MCWIILSPEVDGILLISKYKSKYYKEHSAEDLEFIKSLNALTEKFFEYFPKPSISD